MDYGKIILEELNDWVYNDENQAGDKLQIINAKDFPEIITEIVKYLNILEANNQRKLLIAFFLHFRDKGKQNIGMTIEAFVDDFIKNKLL